LSKDLEETGNGSSRLKVANYKETYKLCESENFSNQPNLKGRACTGFLVDDDIIATAAHCIDSYPQQDLRFVFGYKMLDASTPEIDIPERNVYKAQSVLNRKFNRDRHHPDWAFVQLDRKVEGRQVVDLSQRDVYAEQDVYTIGHPCGLPLKFAPGASVLGVGKANFTASMDIYSGNSGSPVFNANTHELVGIVIHGYTRDFRWTGKCWTTVIYPDVQFGSTPSQCTRVSEFLPTFKGIRLERKNNA
jgi:V8-like Glu-specific endopeptidase